MEGERRFAGGLLGGGATVRNGGLFQQKSLPQQDLV